MSKETTSRTSDAQRLLHVAVAVAALGGLLFGYDTGVISGAILFIRHDFSLSSTMQELVVSAVLAGAVIGAAAGGALADRLGRRRLIVLAGVVFTASALGTAAAPTVAWLIAGRVVIGTAIGVASFVSPMYIAEIVPASRRGSLVAVNQLALTTGIVVAYLVDYALSGSGNWRMMFGVAAVPAALLAVAMWRLPESPRWLMARSRTEEAEQVLRRIRTAPKVEDEVREIRQSLLRQSGGVAVLLRPALRMPLVVGIGLAVFQQITGINTVIYYAPTILEFAGFRTAGSSILATVGVGIVNVAFTAVAIRLLDRVGRRPLLLFGVAGQVAGLCVLGAAFQLRPLSGLVGYLAVGSLAVYIASFAVGLGPVFWLMISEIYPLRVRGAAMSLATVANWALNLAVAATFLTLVNALGAPGTFWLYAVIGVAAWIFIDRLVPETRGKSLEQIEQHWQKGRHPRELGRSAVGNAAP